jgi:hypothetical protein
MRCLFSTTHDVIFFHLCFCCRADAASAIKTNDGINFQLVGISSNFAENVRFNPCPSQPSDSRAIPRNDVRKTANVRCPKAAEAAPWHACTRTAREPMVFDRELEPACHEGRVQLAKTQSFRDRRGRTEDHDGRAIILALAQLHRPCPRPLNHEFHLFRVPRV